MANTFKKYEITGNSQGGITVTERFEEESSGGSVILLFLVIFAIFFFCLGEGSSTESASVEYTTPVAVAYDAAESNNETNHQVTGFLEDLFNEIDVTLSSI